MKFQAPRGTRDILPADQPLWQLVRRVCQEVAEQMGYQPITVPTYEEVGLFQRSIGASTDIIEKELFLVQGHRDEESHYALRPEGTAGIVRAFVQHGMHTWPQPVKLYGIVNNFRYERPQKGRYREHVQLSVEHFGDTSPFADAWVVFTMWQVIRRLGIPGITLSLNSLGTSEERAAYVAALKSALQDKREQLSADSQRRLETNPLRILDSKDTGDQVLLETAPQLADFLGNTSSAHIETVKHYLDAWQIPYAMNPRLVRGLDYYCHTCFEWIHPSTGNSLGGGGRYDKLVGELDGPETGAVGAGLGLDRIVDLLADLGIAAPAAARTVAVILAEPSVLTEAARVVAELANVGIRVTADFSKPSVGTQFKAADRQEAWLAIVIGGQEVADGALTVKRLADGSQERVSNEEIVSFVQKELA